MPEGRNSEIGSEVDFLANEILRQLRDDRRTQLLGKVFSVQLEKNCLKGVGCLSLQTDSQLRGDSQETNQK
jgi:hypothetical protein